MYVCNYVCMYVFVYLFIYVCFFFWYKFSFVVVVFVFLTFFERAFFSLSLRSLFGFCFVFLACFEWALKFVLC